MPAHLTHLVALNIVIHSPIGLPFTVLFLANHDAYSFDQPGAPASQHPSSPPYADVHAH